MKTEDVLRRVDIFLKTPFAGGRHERRVNEISDIENK
jgi:ribose 5-phosphate isomerase RpiB